MAHKVSIACITTIKVSKTYPASTQRKHSALIPPKYLRRLVIHDNVDLLSVVLGTLPSTQKNEHKLG